MPAGSGPLPVIAAAAAVGTTETIIATLPASNWANPSQLGNLVEFSGVFTPPASAGSLVLKIRQGNAVTGTQIGATFTLPVASATVTPAAIVAVDASAYGNAQQGGQYVVTAQYAAAAGGTVTGIATLETCAPIA